MTGIRWQTPAALALSALLAGVWLSYSGAKPSPHPTRPAPASTSDHQSRAELSAVERQLGALRTELASLKQDVDSARAPSADAAESAAPAAPPAPVAPVSTSAEEVHARLDLAFADEPVDTAWAVAEQRSIGDFVEQEAPAAKVEEVTCRSEMCRVKLKFESEREVDRFRTKIGTPPLDNGGFYHTEDTQFTYFASRKGHRLPLAALE